MRIKTLALTLIVALSILTVTISIVGFAVYRERLALTRAYNYYLSTFQSLESLAAATSIALTTAYNFEATNQLVDKTTSDIDQKLQNLNELEKLTATELSDQYISIVRVRLGNLRQISTTISQKVDLGQCFSFNYNTFRQKITAFTLANTKLDTKDTTQIKTAIDDLTLQARQISSTISDIFTCFASSRSFINPAISKSLNGSKYYFEALINNYTAVSGALQDKNSSALQSVLEEIKKLDSSQVELLKPQFLQTLDQTTSQTIKSSLEKEKEFGQKIAFDI